MGFRFVVMFIASFMDDVRYVRDVEVCMISYIPGYETNEAQTCCKTVQVLFLQGHSTCFGRMRPSSGVFKTSTADTGTCVIVAGKSSHLLIRTGRP